MYTKVRTGRHGVVGAIDRPEQAHRRQDHRAHQHAQHNHTDEPADVFLGYDTALEQFEAEAALESLLAMLTYQYPVQLEVDESMTPVVRIVEALLAKGAAREIGSATEIVAG